MIKKEKKLLKIAAVFVILLTVVYSACEVETDDKETDGLLTITDVPDEYIEAYADFTASNKQSFILNRSFTKIENNTVLIPVWIYDGYFWKSYTVNEKITSDPNVDLTNENMTNTYNRWIGLWIKDNSDVLAIRSFEEITFIRGKAKLSWNDGIEIPVKTSP